jgi:non-specific serine/threonine protein kinase/serine/threonine-protein kinase
LCPACLLDAALGAPDAPSEAAFAGDDSLPFDIVTIIAQDAGAATYLARGFVSTAYVALKIADVADVPAVLARADAWRPRLDAVRHRGISRLLGAGAAGVGRIYLATEYVAGSSLDYLLRHRTLSLADRSAIACQLAEAVDAMRAHGLAHMRLEASRVKVAASGDVRATILGFGASLILDGARPTPDLDSAALDELCRALGVARP